MHDQLVKVSALSTSLLDSKIDSNETNASSSADGDANNKYTHFYSADTSNDV
jgi:hypothetical protein